MKPHALAVVHAVLRLAVIIVPAAYAQEPPALDDLERLTPQALVQAVEASNAGLRMLAAAAQAAAFRVEPAAALEDPRLMYGVALGTVGGDARQRGVVELRQALPWPGTRGLLRDAAQEGALAAREDVEAARLDVVAAAKAAHAEWYYLHRAVEINASSARVMAAHARVAEDRFAAGRALRQDVLQAQVEQALLDEQRGELEQELVSLRARINALLDRPPAAPLPPPAEPREPAALPDLEAARAALLPGHPQLRRLQHEIAGANAEAQLAEKAFRPQFEASLAYNEMWADPDMRWMLGVTVNVPMQRGRRRAELDAALADVRRGEHALAEQTAALAAQLESAHARTRHVMHVLRLYEERLLELVDRNVEAALADYQGGAGQFLSVLEAERQRLATRQAYERARADYWRAHAELERVFGAELTLSTTSSISR